jgi:hypothetical protein
MHTIVETPGFIRSARRAGVTQEELDDIRGYLALHPDAGPEMPGTGGARKVRFAAKGRGKRGGYRVITFYSGEEVPLFLLDIYAKGERVDLTQQDKNTLRTILGRIVEEYRRRA